MTLFVSAYVAIAIFLVCFFTLTYISEEAYENNKFNLILAAGVSLFCFGFISFSVFLARKFNLVRGTEEYASSVKKEIYQHVSYHDDLTGLPNRTLFLDRVSHAISKVGRAEELLAILYIDIDRFKLVNDNASYQCGDKVLKLIADRLQITIRDCDTVARINGDEFALLLDPVVDENGAAIVAKRVLESFYEVFKIGSEEIILSCSIGIAVYPNDSVHVEALFANAENAMQKVKRSGGANFQFYTSDMNLSNSKRLKKEQMLREALTKGEYVLYYQPKINLNKAGLVGMEALLRWRSGKVLVPPDEFISVLEESGLILPVGEWVLFEACRQNKKWMDAGYAPLVMSVNVSAVQFRQANFVEIVCRVLKKTGLDPKYLEVEVTEGVLMADTQSSVTVLNELKTIGIRVAIDDFGTGYSSLSYLQRYPIDTLKIDRAFVSGIESRNEDAAITTTIVGLAHNLRLNIVAEGVETPEQMAFLNAVGCQELQGFLFSKPVCASEFEKFLTENGLLFKHIPQMNKNRA